MLIRQAHPRRGLQQHIRFEDQPAPPCTLAMIEHVVWHSALPLNIKLQAQKKLKSHLSYAGALELQRLIMASIEISEAEQKESLRNRIIRRVHAYPELFQKTPHGQEAAQSLAYTISYEDEVSWQQMERADRWSETMVETWLAVGQQ